MSLTPLGVPRLWGNDPETLWWEVQPVVGAIVAWLAPSYAYGVERVPREGGSVLAANHLSAIDPPLIGATSPRPIFYMTKAELLTTPVIGDLLTWLGAFPVRRGEGDREALRRARELARDGHMVGVFVEGTRQRLGFPGKVLPGGLMIALHENVPVVPCGVYSFGWKLKNRARCAVVWGEAIELEGFPRSGRGYRDAADVVSAELVRLWRQAGEAVAEGFPPELRDGAKRSETVYRAEGGTMPSASTSVKKALA